MRQRVFLRKIATSDKHNFCRNFPAGWDLEGDSDRGSEPNNTARYFRQSTCRLIFLLQCADFFLRPIDLGFSAASHGQEFLLPPKV